MTNSIAALHAFDLLDIHNPPNHKGLTLVGIQYRAQLDLHVLPNYVIYDPNGAARAPLLPEIITAEWWIIKAVPSLVQAEWEDWQDYVGVKSTLVAIKMDLTTYVSATARLESIADISLPEKIYDNRKKVRGVFVPLEPWADV